MLPASPQWPSAGRCSSARSLRIPLEHGSRIIADSGRKWGKSGTEAVTAWKPYRPNQPGSGVGSAKTYYGK
ncbi:MULTISPECIES: hypothetical protein [unclassified Curtobacterium]|uniref:hypothetical protein n=1 Tax=unclassified Curtobacterium TaxID=257496 RepID=UPI0010523297|nr:MULTISPECIES: hypothetical protein [unclassified Curtobacterium]